MENLGTLLGMNLVKSPEKEQDMKLTNTVLLSSPVSFSHFKALSGIPYEKGNLVSTHLH